MDVLNKKQRSHCMSSVKNRGTNLELSFTKEIYSAGLRGYRLKSKLLGKPDIYFPSKKLAIFIDGCFWHGCPKCNSRPKTNKKFWFEKIRVNIQRDHTVTKQLKNRGVIVQRFWEHEIKNNPSKCVNEILGYFST